MYCLGVHVSDVDNLGRGVYCLGVHVSGVDNLGRGVHSLGEVCTALGSCVLPGEGLRVMWTARRRCVQLGKGVHCLGEVCTSWRVLRSDVDSLGVVSTAWRGACE